MLKKLLPTIERLFSLMVVFLMLSATTLWTGRFLGKEWGTHEETVSVEQAVTESPTKEQLSDLGIEDKLLVPRDSASWYVYTPAKDKKLGILLSSAPYSRDVVGFAGATPLYIFLDGNNKVKGITPGENLETGSFFHRASEGILHHWYNLPADEALALEVDAVTGATYSSHALIENTRNALAAYTSSVNVDNSKPVIGWVRTIALFIVMGIGIFASYRLRGNKKWRLVVLVLNVGVTGFWCGQFLSVSILKGWIENGTHFVQYLPTLVMLAIAILMPYLGRPNHYCTWVCPYGSLQELAWFLPVPKVKIGAKMYRIMSYIRTGVLMVLMLMLWMGYGVFLLDYEPFSAFIFTTAAPAVIVLAAAFVILGIFIPHPWCRCLCPVGALLNLAEEKK